MQRACASALNVSVGHRPWETLLYARTVHPLFWLMNVSEMPLVPSLQTALSALPQPTTAVPAGQFALTVVMHVPFAPGVHAPVAPTVVTVLPGPGGPCGPSAPCGPCGPCAPCAPGDPAGPAGPCGPP